MSTEVDDKVLPIVSEIKKKHTGDAGTTSDVKVALEKKNNKNESVRGIPKSGRFWKTKKERFSSVNKTKGLKQDFQKKTALRLELKRTKELSKQVQEELKEKELVRKERRRENIKKSLENKQKAEVVQVITNTAKLRRMRKKQLRFIEKRDTTKIVEASN